MQLVKINNVEYNIPISWEELTYKKAIDVLSNINDKGKQLNVISGIPIEIINSMKDLDISKIFALISFTENLDVFDSENVIEEYNDFDYGSIPYKEAEQCRNIMINSKESGFDSVIDIIKTLTKYDITNEPFLKVIGTANFFLSNSIIFMIGMPSLAQMDLAMMRSQPEQKDYKVLEGLLRMLKSQDQELSETQ